MHDDAIIRPKSPGQWPEAPKIALMIHSPADLSAILSQTGLSRKHGRTFLNSRLFLQGDGPAPFCIAGPFIGAPYAVILLETLIAWGVRQVLFFGWCGSMHPDVAIGDLVVPSAAHIADGTSPSYLHSRNDGTMSFPSSELNARILSQCREMGLAFHNGPIWTTDAVFRETPELIEHYQRKGVLGVEMEAAALFAVGAFRGVDVSAVMAVSDELHTMKWRPGFGASRFRTIRKTAMDLLLQTTHTLQDTIS